MRSWNDNLKKVAYVLIAVSLVPVVWFLIIGSTSKRKVRPEWLSKDLKTIESMIYDHADPFWKNPKDVFKRYFKNAEKSIRKTHRMDFFLLIQPIFALLEDHESFVHFGMPSYMPVLPFKVYFHDGELYIYDSISADAKNGSRIEEFDGMDLEKFKSFLRKYIGAESESQWEILAENFIFRLPSIQRKEAYRIKISGKDMKIYSVPISKYNAMKSKIYGREKPFYTFEMDGVTVLKIKTFSMWGQDIQDFEDTVENLASRSRRLIVDLRDNPGGDWREVKVLIEHLIKKSTSLRNRLVFSENSLCGGGEKEENITIDPKDPVFDGKLLVLVNRKTLDEAYDAAVILSKNAPVVGENPDMGIFRFTAVRFKRLPSVGMYFTLSCAKEFYLDTVKIDRYIPEKGEEFEKRIKGEADDVLKKAIEVIK